MHLPFRKAGRCLGAYARDCRGNVATMVAMSAIPMLMGIGFAIDYARLTQFTTELKSAADAAALAGAAETVDPTIPLTPSLSAKRRQIAISAFRANLGSSQELSAATVTVTDIANGIRISASVEVSNIFGQILGRDTTSLSTVAEAGLATNTNYEVAFVLDNTGSMASSGKMTTLKAAMNKFLGKLEASATAADNVRVAIVPFANMVRVDVAQATDKPWLRQNAGATAVWSGCIADRASPYDANGGAPDLSTPATLYDAVDGSYQVFPLPPLPSILPPFSSPNPGTSCDLARIMPLTSSFGAMYAAVSSMVPTGATNLTVGLAWGLNVLSPGEPVNSAYAFGGSHRKILVLVTDGQNTQSRWTTDTPTMNAATLVACNAIKARGVTVYTIGVMDEDAALLTACASDPGKHFFAPTADKVPDIFNMLSNDLTTVRLTR